MFSSNTTQVSDGGYQISRSLRFNSADTTNLNRTFASAGNRKTFTLSFWLKRSRVGVNYEGFFASGNGTDQIRFENIDQLRFSLNSTASGDFVTTQVFRDVSAWYHIVFAVDTTQATSTNRVKIYVNGSQITSFTTASYPTLNYDCNFNSNVSHRLGIANDTSYPFNGYMTETYLIDGQALTPSSFGETNAQTGVWQPKAFSGGAFGTNGFYLNFSDNSNTTAATLGKDYSGNGNNWTPNNFSVTAGAGNDSMVDVPTPYGVDTGAGGNVRGNYSTLNPLNTAYTDKTFSNGNLDVTGSTTNQVGGHSTMQIPTTGQWYAECVMTAFGSGSPFIGVNGGTTTLGVSGASYRTDGTKELNGTGSSYGATWTTNDVIGIAVDTGAGSITFYKNGTSQGVAYTTLNTNFTNGLFFSCQGAAGTTTFVYNFGQRPFAYTAPSGYKALCTQNLPTPTIGATTATQAGKYFGVTLRTGGAPSGGTYTTTVDMSNGALLWDKARNQAQNNYLVDSNRGLTKFLQSNATTAESTQASWYTSFGNGTYSTGSTDWGSSVSLVDWIWAAGANTTNTAGSITSTVSANTTSGFSVVTYTGTSANATVGHGLGVAPSMVIVKSRSTVDGWFVYNKEIGNTKYLRLNTTDAASTFNLWQSTSPTSSVFSIATDPTVNLSGATYVAYCFAEVAGYSKFGSYTGNGSTDGPFVYCGFRPRYIMVKGSANSSNWTVIDTARDTYNACKAGLYPNLSAAESDPGAFDILSNGFKIRHIYTDSNGSGLNYIFAAFAEVPTKFSLAR